MLETLNTTVEMIAVPASSVIFYPEHYFTAYTIALGVVCIAIGFFYGRIYQRKVNK
jgi:hypothetical protein